MEVRGQLGALLGADPLGALGREVAAHPPQERGEDQGQREDTTIAASAASRTPAERVVRREEEQRGADHERDPEAAL